MKAIVPKSAGGPDVLDMVERDVPKPGRGQVLVEVEAAGVNRHDCNQRRRGHGPKGSTDILGLEVAGRVVATGPTADERLVGRRVCALVDGGGYAQYALADEALLLDWPEDLDAVEAAALPEALFTLQLNLIELGRLKTGQRLLIHGGTSGIGMTGIPFARRLGVDVIVTAGSDEKCERALARGASAAINYRRQDFVEVVGELTDGYGVDLILDTVGGTYAVRNLKALAMDGCIVHLSPAAPDFCAPLQEIMARRARVTGSLLRAYPLAAKASLAKTIRDGVWDAAASELRPVIDSIYPLTEARAAHERMEAGGHIGKIVLTGGSAGADR